MQFYSSVVLYVTTLRGRLQELNNKGKVQLGNPKSGHNRLPERSLMRAFRYKILITVQNRVSQRKQELVAYESGCKESLDCDTSRTLKSLNIRLSSATS